jgi:hypothetical protein
MMKKKRLNLKKDSKGAVMTLVIIVIVMLVLLGSFVTNLCYNQRLLADAAGGGRIEKYYRAQAGVVDALARLRNNLIPPASTSSYSLDVNSDGTNDVNVTIGAVTNPLTGARVVRATASDV